MTRVIHTGDTHLGYRQYHSPERRADFLDAFRRVIEDAVAEDVDAVVHAGDLFHDRSPALTDVHGAIRVLRDLADAGIPFLAVVGNHERTREGQWLDLFETLGLATRLGDEPTTIGADGSDVALYGLDYVPRSARDDLEYAFAPHDAEFAALVAHGLFTPFNAEWNSSEVLASADVDFDAMLLGDDHQPDTARVEGTWLTYCGSTERTSAAERDERGYNLVDFDADATGGDGDDDGSAATEAGTGERAIGDGVSIRRRGIETRPFLTIDLELAEGEGADRVRERVREEAIEDAVVVVSVEGDGEDLQPARIEEFARERGALIARVRDRREIGAEEAIEAVDFADPDAAVDERIRERGLSEAALAIDETVRSDVADSNVRGRVRERVEELLDEPGAFEPGAPVEAALEPEAGGADEPAGADEPPGAGREADAGGDKPPGPADAPAAGADETRAVDGGETETAGEAGSAVEEPATATDDGVPAAAVADPDGRPADDADETTDPGTDGTPDPEVDESGEADVGEPASDEVDGDDADEGPEPEETSTGRDDGDDRGSGDGQLSMEDYL